uniref:Putative secreted protein n=2 Tax=Ixodes ricinus TaxID=34613 RepID=A0A090XB84_IXORI
MEATKLLLIFVLHYGAGDFSGVVMEDQKPLQFFDRLLHTTAELYDLDPMEQEFSYVVEAGLGTAKVNLYKATVLGLGTAHRLRENYIWVNDSGTCLKIDMGVRNVTITVLANVTVGISIFSYTATIKIDVLANSIQAQLDIEQKSVELKVEAFNIVGVETVEVKSTYIAGSSWAFTTTQTTIESSVKSFFAETLNAKLRGAIEEKLEELQKAIML